MEIKRFEGIHRTAVIKTNEYFKGKYIVNFYYDGCQDYEWKKGSDGVASDIVDDLKKAEAKAKRYIKKDYK